MSFLKDMPLLTKGITYIGITLGGYVALKYLSRDIKAQKAQKASDKLIETAIIAEGKTTAGQYSAASLALMLKEALLDFDTNETVVWRIFGNDKNPVGLIQSKQFLAEVKAAYYVATKRETNLDQDLKNISLGWFTNFNGSDYQEVLRSLARINKKNRITKK